MNNNSETIRRFAESRSLTRVDLAELFGVSEFTVGSWFRSVGSASYRNPPHAYVKLVRFMQDVEHFRENRFVDLADELGTLQEAIASLPETAEGHDAKTAWAKLYKKIAPK